MPNKARISETWYAVEDNLSKTPRLAGEVTKYKQAAVRERDEFFMGCNIVPVMVSWTPSGKRFRTNGSKKAT